MARTTTNYTGRSVDLFIFQNATYFGRNSQLTLELGSPSQVTAGIQAAAQRWLVMFLTQRNSVIGDAEFGTSFMEKLLSRQITDEIGIQQEFSIAVREINDYVSSNVDTSILRDDEVIVDAALLPGWQLNRTSLKLRVGLTTRAGNSYTVITPVSLAIS